MSLSAESIATGVDPKARFSGGQWRARCPVHDGTSQNFYVKDAGESVLLHCFRGCTFEELTDALRSRGLWADRKQQDPPQGFTKDELEYFHLWCLTYRDNVRKGYSPTKEEDAKFRRLSKIIYQESTAP